MLGESDRAAGPESKVQDVMLLNWRGRDRSGQVLSCSKVTGVITCFKKCGYTQKSNFKMMPHSTDIFLSFYSQA